MLSLPSRHLGDATPHHSSLQERVSLGSCLTPGDRWAPACVPHPRSLVPTWFSHCDTQDNSTRAPQHHSCHQGIPNTPNGWK